MIRKYIYVCFTSSKSLKKISNVTWTAYYWGPLFRRALDILLKTKPIYIYGFNSNISVWELTEIIFTNFIFLIFCRIDSFRWLYICHLTYLYSKILILGNVSMPLLPSSLCDWQSACLMIATICACLRSFTSGFLKYLLFYTLKATLFILSHNFITHLTSQFLF